MEAYAPLPVATFVPENYDNEKGGAAPVQDAVPTTQAPELNKLRAELAAASFVTVFYKVVDVRTEVRVVVEYDPQCTWNPFFRALDYDLCINDELVSSSTLEKCSAEAEKVRAARERYESLKAAYVKAGGTLSFTETPVVMEFTV